MIFVTVGFQLPFDRLIEAMDQIAFDLKDEPVVAQVSSKSRYKVKNMKVLGFISPSEIDRYFDEARLIVSHAGMGTILSALEKGKSIIVMPRMVKFNEVTTNHQLATVKMFEQMMYVHTAVDVKDLRMKVLAALDGSLQSTVKINKLASRQLINSINSFISM